MTAMFYTAEDKADVAALDNELLRNGRGIKIDNEAPVDLLFTDEEGELIFRIPPPMAEMIIAANVEDGATILCWIQGMIRAEYDRGYRQGTRVGRAAVVDTVHELLGIDKITQAIANQGGA